MNRRQFIQGIGADILAVSSDRLSGGRPAAKKHNVLFLIADDMNDYGFYKTFPGLKMPYMDAFRKTALTFDKAYCASPVCVPSRAANFSGLYPHTTGAYKNGSDPWDKTLDKIESLPECFKRNGYTTFGRGKLFHAPIKPAREQAMWDNRPIYGGGFGPFPTKEEGWQGGEQFFSFKAWEKPDTDFPDVVNSQAAVEFLKQDHDKPFFLTLGIWRPHTPLTAPKRFFDMYDIEQFPQTPPGYDADDISDIPPLGLKLIEIWKKRWDKVGVGDKPLWREFIRAYFACTTFADWSIGQVLEALDKSPYADNTIVIFWSDNGYHLGEKNRWEKATLWEASARCPMFVRIPDRTPAGKTCLRPISLIDMYPTLVDYCGLEKPAHALEGQSLRPLIENPDAEWQRPALTTYGEHYVSLRAQRWRYIRYPDGTEELYDHDKDPWEITNLASDEKLQDIKKQFEKWIPKNWAPTLGGKEG